MSSPRQDFKARIDVIEESYEFFLAYAAQGLSGDQASKSGGQLREFLGSMTTALEGIAGAMEAVVDAEGLEPAGPWGELVGVLERDAASALAAVRLVAGQPSISSQLVDNLNANIHLRALLTDLFLLDEALPRAG